MPALAEQRSLQLGGGAAALQVSRTIESACRMLTRSGRARYSVGVELPAELVRRCGGTESTARLIESQAARYAVGGELTCEAGHLSVTLSALRAIPAVSA